MAIRGSWSNRLFSSTILGTFNCTPGPKLYMGVSCLVQQAKKSNPSESRGQHDHVQPALRPLVDLVKPYSPATPVLSDIVRSQRVFLILGNNHHGTPPLYRESEPK